MKDGDTSAQNTIKTKKQTLKDAPAAASAIANASNITQSKAWDTTDLENKSILIEEVDGIKMGTNSVSDSV